MWQRGMLQSLCVFVRTRRDFDTSNWDSKGDHIYSQKHGEKKTAQKYHESVDERERLKTEEDGIAVLPKKPKVQASLPGLKKSFVNQCSCVKQ